WADIDLSHTVGFLSVHYPLYLHLPEGLSPHASVARVREHFDIVPNHVFGYAILRFLFNQETLLAPIPVYPEPEFGVNYIGNLDSMFATSEPFKIAREYYGMARDPGGQFLFKIGLLLHIRDGKLQADWMCSANLYKRETLEQIVAHFCENLLSWLAETPAFPGTQPQADSGEELRDAG